MVRIAVFVLTVVFGVGSANETPAQDAGQRTRELVAALDKTKYKKKEKANVRIEIYIDIKYEPVIKASGFDHGGIYEDEGRSFRLDLHILSGGAIEANGYDTRGVEAKQVRFTLRDARVEGALLTGTKVFENGETQKFEAVFANRTVSSGTNAASITSRETQYGIGFIQSDERWTNRVFLEKR